MVKENQGQHTQTKLPPPPLKYNKKDKSGIYSMLQKWNLIKLVICFSLL